MVENILAYDGAYVERKYFGEDHMICLVGPIAATVNCRAADRRPLCAGAAGVEGTKRQRGAS